MKGLTDRQLLVLRVIADSVARDGRPPTFREIGAAIDVSSTNGISDHIKALRRKGFLRPDDETSKSRNLVLTVAGWQATGRIDERQLERAVVEAAIAWDGPHEANGAFDDVAFDRAADALQKAVAALLAARASTKEAA